MLFFFKQKTAYEMRISDWSSDVCSSDLVPEQGGQDGAQFHGGVLGSCRSALGRDAFRVGSKQGRRAPVRSYRAYCDLSCMAGVTCIACQAGITPASRLAPTARAKVEIGRAHV